MIYKDSIIYNDFQELKGLLYQIKCIGVIGKTVFNAKRIDEITNNIEQHIYAYESMYRNQQPTPQLSGEELNINCKLCGCQDITHNGIDYFYCNRCKKEIGASNVEVPVKVTKKPKPNKEQLRNEIISPYGRDLFVIKHSQINLMKTYALIGLTNEYNKYCGIRKRTTNNDKIKTYDYILGDVIKKKKQIMNFDIKHHTYCLESAQEFMVLQEIIKLCKSDEWIKGITLKEQILNLLENIKYFELESE